MLQGQKYSVAVSIEGADYGEFISHGRTLGEAVGRAVRHWERRAGAAAVADGTAPSYTRDASGWHALALRVAVARFNDDGQLVMLGK